MYVSQTNLYLNFVSTGQYSDGESVYRSPWRRKLLARSRNLPPRETLESWRQNIDQNRPSFTFQRRYIVAVIRIFQQQHYRKLFVGFCHLLDIIGKRACLGEPLARNTYFLFTASLLKVFEFHPLPDRPLPTLKPKNGLTLSYDGFEAIVTPRSWTHYINYTSMPRWIKNDTQKINK